VYRRRPGQLHYEKVTTARTNEAGAMRTTVPFDGSGSVFSLRVYATNSAVAVNVKDNGAARFYDRPGSPGPEILRSSASPDDTLDFSWRFEDDFARGHFNVADAMLRGFAYANMHRDPREAAVESIAQVTVQISSSLTYYDPVTKVVRVNWKHVMDDLSALHEYAHYLEERVSGFTGVPAGHDGCVATLGATHVESPEYAWMEGFASYFAVAVANWFGADVDGSGGGTLNREAPSCPGSPQPTIALEMFVAVGSRRQAGRAVRQVLHRLRHRSERLPDLRSRTRHRPQSVAAELHRCMDCARIRPAAADQDVRRQPDHRHAAANRDLLRHLACRQSRGVAPGQRAVVGHRELGQAASRVG
jgi:hypothetical protein